MEVQFTAEQEAQLAQLATKAGTDAPHLVKDAAHWCPVKYFAKSDKPLAINRIGDPRPKND